MNYRTKTKESALEVLSALVASCRTATGVREHIPPGYTEPTVRERVPAVRSGTLDLRTLVLMPPASETAVHGFNYKTSPVVENRSKSVALDAAVIGNSRVADLGAMIIVAADRDMATTTDIPALYRDAGLFRAVEPAKFTLVADGDDAAISPVPWRDAPITWPYAPSIAFRAMITRRQMKDVGGGSLLEENLLDAILGGLSLAADSTLLSAIVASNPAAFSLGAAAARGIHFKNLGAAIGVNGTGAAVGQDGILRAAGIAGALTPTIAQTVIGDFHKSAVAIHPEINVHMERMNVDGDVGCVVFASLLPLVPDASAFWLAGA